MKKSSIFKTLALGLLSLALISGPADAAGPASCPAFTAAMVDAAALAADLVSESESVAAVDDPGPPLINCIINTTFDGIFSVNVSGVAGSAFLSGSNNMGEMDGTSLRNIVDGLTVGQAHACRGQVLQSWVWNQICAAAVVE